MSDYPFVHRTTHPPILTLLSARAARRLGLALVAFARRTTARAETGYERSAASALARETGLRRDRYRTAQAEQLIQLRRII